MNHVSEITKHQDFYKKDFLILGTGPSLDNFVWEDHKDKNIIAIYDAIESCPSVFIHFAPDAPYFEGDGLYERLKGKYIPRTVTRAFNQKYEGLFSRTMPQQIGYYFEYDCDIKNHPNPNHEIPYDGVFHGGDGKRYFPFHTPWPCSCTNKAIAHFLGTAGIKKVYTCGIDGGRGYSKYVLDARLEEYNERSSEQGVSWDQEVQDFRDTCKHFNIEIIRL